MTEQTFQATAVGGKYDVLYRPHLPKKAVNLENLRPRTVRVVVILGAALTALGAILFVIGQ